MNDQYNEIYSTLNKYYQYFYISDIYAVRHREFRDPILRNSASFVANAVSQTVAKLKLESRLRSDAYHFLLVNFHQMIVAPMLMRRSDLEREKSQVVDEYIKDDQLLEILSNDIETVLLAAAESSVEDKISGHMILDAVSRKYKDLRATKFDIWG